MGQLVTDTTHTNTSYYVADNNKEDNMLLTSS